MGDTTEETQSEPTDHGVDLALPDIPGTESGMHLARRAVSLAFAVFGLLVAAGVLVGLFVEVDVTVDARGTIEPAVVETVRSPSTGVLVEVGVAPGDTVAEGTVLARLDLLGGRDEGALHGDEGWTTLCSPVHGVVRETEKPHSLGQTVAGGEVVFEVASIDRWRAELIVGERDIGTIQIGDPAKIDVIALQSEKKDLLHGTVTSISREPAVIPGDTAAAADRGAQRGYRVTIRLDGHETKGGARRQLRDGYSVTGKIVTRRGRVLPLVWRFLRRSASV